MLNLFTRDVQIYLQLINTVYIWVICSNLLLFQLKFIINIQKNI